MTELDRRAVVTGLAAVAVAGVSPNRLEFDEQITPREIILGSAWRFQQDDAGRICIRHTSSGLGFVNDPQPDGTPDFNCIVPDSSANAAPIWRAFERAASFVAKEASGLRVARAHPGAIYVLCFEGDQRDVFDEIITEDAPPSPWVGSFFAWGTRDAEIAALDL